MATVRPVVLSIAGLDPSGGAGLLADVKTFEANKVYGLGIVSANTFQNDIHFERAEWIDIKKIKEQVELLKQRYKIEYVKIGLIESLDVLQILIEYLKLSLPKTKLIWDPILKASAGFEFHKKIDMELLEIICKDLFLITPNVPEAVLLGAMEDASLNAQQLSTFCNVYLKGGHNEQKKGYDYLYTAEGKRFSFRPKKLNVSEKHGSGCVLASAITANLAKGFKLHKACLRAKNYTAEFLSSNASLSGYHKL